MENTPVDVGLVVHMCLWHSERGRLYRTRHGYRAGTTSPSAEPSGSARPDVVGPRTRMVRGPFCQNWRKRCCRCLRWRAEKAGAAVIVSLWLRIAAQISGVIVQWAGRPLAHLL